MRGHGDPLFLDIGANIGLMTLNVLAELPAARVVAFEPGRHQAEFMSNTIRENGLEERVTLIRAALGREKGTAEFAVHRSQHSSGDGFVDTGRAGGTSRASVEVLTLDEWWADRGMPGVQGMKIDTEGAELWVLEGGRRLLQACRPLVVFELHPENLQAYPHSASDVVGFLHSLGYAVTTLGGKTVELWELEECLRRDTEFVGLPES
jgi:FkbM family methyltransferase